MPQSLQGLTQAEVESRLRKFGQNQIEENRLASSARNAIKILSDPMGLMLLSLSVLYWYLGKKNDAIILLIAYIPIVAVDVLLELRSQKALRALKSSIKSTCNVIREGRTQAIHTRHLVPGDLLVLEEGQSIPADGILVQASNLTIDEATVTGESIPVEKSSQKEALSGTTVLTGNGIVEIQQTGLSSQIGTIAKVLSGLEAESSPLLRTINKAVKIIVLVAIILAVLVFALGIARGNNISESLLSSLTLAMAAIPEEFPLVFTIYLSLAAFRLSKKGILVKSLPAVEGLGRADVICTDKTGTITEGNFKLEAILGRDDGHPLSATEQNAFLFSCEPKAVDAMEASMFDWFRHQAGQSLIDELHSKWQLKYDFPFQLKEKYMSHVWENAETGEQLLALKGAFESVLSRCAATPHQDAIHEIARAAAQSGKRLLGLAYRQGTFTGQREVDEKSLIFIGILSFTDPVRPQVKEAIQDCIKHGIKIKMLTGDHLLTAHSIADLVELPHEHHELFTGHELESLPILQRKDAYRKGAIFARLKPEQKLELVQTLKDDGKRVAMTGDGINDVPALKLADVGISMGDRATDIARSTAQLVLLKNDFGGIVSSIREGQRVLKSLSESFGYLIAFHIPIIAIALYQALFMDVTMIAPIHIVLLQLIVHPVSALVFQQDEQTPLIEPQRKFLSTEIFLWSALRGITLTALSLFFFCQFGGTEREASSLAVLLLIVGNIGLLLGERGGLVAVLRREHTFRTSLACIILAVLATLLAFQPHMARIFSIHRPSLPQFLAVLATGILLSLIARRSPSVKK